MKIIWTQPAADDLDGIYQYIRQDSEYYAKKVVRDIVTYIERLVDQPEMGRVVPEKNDEGLREIFMDPYRIIYRPTAERITILVIIHGRRDLSKIQV